MIYHTFLYQHTCIYNICLPTHVVAKQNFILITNTFNPQIIYILFFKYYSNYLKEQHLSTTYLLQIYMYYITIYLPKHVVARQSVTLTTDNLMYIYIYTRYYFFFFSITISNFYLLTNWLYWRAIILSTTYCNIHYTISIYQYMWLALVARHICALTTNILACK